MSRTNTVLGALPGAIIACCKPATIYSGSILGVRDEFAMSILCR